MPSGRRKRSRRADVEQRDGRWTQGYIHIGRVTVYPRGRNWYLHYREGGVERRIRIGHDRRETERHAAEVNAQLVCGIRSTFQFERIDLQEAHERGLRTFGMPCPILPSVAESVDALQGMFEELRDCGVEDIWTEIDPRWTLTSWDT